MKSEDRRGIGPLGIIVLIIAIGVFAFSGYNLYKILMDYHKTDVEYDGLNKNYTKKRGSAVPTTEDPDVWPKYEDAEVPMDVDWDELKKINSDVVGWVYMEGDEHISYPITWRLKDDEYYLHRSYSGEYLYAGSIFLEGMNWPDFADPISVVYGHNMKNGSMFAGLKDFRKQEVYNEHPYFWILTPDGNYRYHIYSVFETEGGDKDVYQLFSMKCKKFVEWEKKMQSMSEVTNKVPFFEDDNSVILSTCQSDHVHRTVVIGRCVSSVQPERKNKEWESRGTEGNMPYDIEKEEQAEKIENGAAVFNSNDPIPPATEANDDDFTYNAGTDAEEGEHVDYGNARTYTGTDEENETAMQELYGGGNVFGDNTNLGVS